MRERDASVGRFSIVSMVKYSKDLGQRSSEF